MSALKIGCIVIAIVEVSRQVLRTLIGVCICRTHGIVGSGRLLLRTTVGLVMLLAHQSAERIRSHSKGAMTKVITRVLTTGGAEAAAARRRNVLATTESGTTGSMLFMLLIVRNGFQASRVCLR